MTLDDEVCEFLTSGVSIVLASCNGQLTPSVARAKGCVVRRDATSRLRIFVSAAHAGELLEDVRGSGMIATTFSLPTTHRTLQFKGADAIILPLQDEDREAIAAYKRAFAQSILPLGFSGEFLQAFLSSPPDEVAIEFTPSAAFQQTPGPAAGARLA